MTITRKLSMSKQTDVDVAIPKLSRSMQTEVDVSRPEEKTNRFIESLVNFTQNTTFHGIKYMVKPKSRMRRCMWTLFVLTCLIAVIFQVVDRVMYYYSWPLNVNVKINYNQTIKFPAVTICNQNAFRATQAARLGRYGLIKDMFSKSHKITDEVLDTHNASNISLEDLYLSLSHRKEDLIVNCEWNKVTCSAADFVLKLTDHGVCFTYTGDTKYAYVSSPGVESGLRLTLNVEQYEYMAGPHGSAGVKMLLHDPNESPLVYELGQAIPTGTHAFVGVKLMMISNMPFPYGNCDNRPLKHTDYYTTQDCFSVCLLTFAERECGCRDIYMPSLKGGPVVCTIKQSNCLEDLKERFNNELKSTCDCPIACDLSMFDTSQSYATISNQAVSKLLKTTETAQLKDKYIAAAEVTARMDDFIFQELKDKIDNLDLWYRENKGDILRIFDELKTQFETIKYVQTNMTSVYTTKETLYRYQIYVIDRNFLRAREAMEERTLRNVANVYAEFSLLIDLKIKRLAEMDGTQGPERESLKDLIIDSLEVRKHIVALAKENITQLIDSFKTGIQIFNYQFENIPKINNQFIVPRKFLNNSLYHNYYMEKHLPQLTHDHLDFIAQCLDNFVNETLHAFYKHSYNESQVSDIRKAFNNGCRNFLFSKSVVYDQGLDQPTKVLNGKLNGFNNSWLEFTRILSTVLVSTSSLLDSISFVETTIFPKFDRLISSYYNYTLNDNSSLLKLSEQFLSADTNKAKTGLQMLFGEIKLRDQIIGDAWDSILKPTTDLWNIIVNDENMIEYYYYTNITEFLRNLTDVVEEWNNIYNGLRLNGIKSHISHEEKLFTALELVTNHFKTFNESFKIDSTFLRDNFLRLDIFYRQLSYEEITQQKAFDFFTLICDIGGAMGLFIGASVLTIAEIIDLVVMQITAIRCARYSKKSSTA